MVPTRLVNQQASHAAHTPLLGGGARPGIGGNIQISAVFGDDHYVLRGTITEAA